MPLNDKDKNNRNENCFDTKILQRSFEFPSIENKESQRLCRHFMGYTMT